jgi:hypothetical protein
MLNIIETKREAKIILNPDHWLEIDKDNRDSGRKLENTNNVEAVVNSEERNLISISEY